eukprot:scaffold2727_cov275-Chaetoceros_neogracile.AAC.40
MVQQFQLRGHQGPVTCLAHSSNAQRGSKKKVNRQTHNTSCCLLSGSEDGTARLWDLRTNPSRASSCIMLPNRQEVTSVAFHPTFDESDASTLISGSSSYPFTIFASVGSSVYGYDLRQASSPIIQKHHHLLDSLEGEEINQIQMTTAAQTNKRIYIGTADDDGFVRITDSIPNRFISEKIDASSSLKGKECTKLQHCENMSEAALVTSIAFRPRSKTLDLASGGTDCTVCLWDVNRPKRPSSTFVIRTEEEEGVNQICNPPFVNALSWSPSGKLLAAGLGDGSAIVMQMDGRSLIEGCRLRGGHDAAVASVLFPNFGGLDSSHVVAEDRLLVTGGNDGSIFLWDLGKKLVSNGEDPSTIFKDCYDNSMKVDEAMKGLALDGANGDDPKILFGLQHGKKPNYIESCNASDPVFPTSLFVADTSQDITVYTFPRP